MDKNIYHLYPDRIVTPHKILAHSSISFDPQGNFLIDQNAEMNPQPDSQESRFEGGIAVPGLIDTHVHGGYGVSFGSGMLREGLEKYSAWAAGHGVTGFLLTISGPDPDFISGALIAYAAILEQVRQWPGAIPLGFHLEGPYLSKEKPGAFNPTWLHVPDLHEMQQLVEAGHGWVKHVSLAPELKNSQTIAAYLAKHGVKASLGHSNADYETARAALEGDFSHVTHTFNAQSGLHHRAPGVVGAVLSSQAITAELIGDSNHIHPAVMQILVRCLGPARVVLITDAMAGAGLPDGDYELVGHEVAVRDGRATLADGTLAGSVVTMDSAIRTLVREAGVSLKDAVLMGSYNPAKLIGLDGEMGAIENGKQGNLVILDDHLTIQKTFVKGQLVFPAQ